MKCPAVVYSSLTHAFFGQGRRLVIRWLSQGSYPGFFEISEYKLGSQHPLYTANVQWDDYENHMIKWVASNDAVVNDRSEIFKNTWIHFLSVKDEALADRYDPKEIFSTLDAPSPVLAITEMLEKIAEHTPSLHDFWNSKCMEMVSNYGHWLHDLKTCGNFFSSRI